MLSGRLPISPSGKADDGEGFRTHPARPARSPASNLLALLRLCEDSVTRYRRLVIGDFIPYALTASSCLAFGAVAEMLTEIAARAKPPMN